MAAKLKDIKVELQLRMRDRVADVGAWLRKVVSGYYLYHAVPGNIVRLDRVRGLKLNENREYDAMRPVTESSAARENRC